jgi:hypothetical protein
MNIPSWCEIRKENFRVVVDERRSRHTASDCNDLANTINEIINEHKGFEDISAAVECDEVPYCKMCNRTYEPTINDKGVEVCSYCGKGKLEYTVQILSEDGEPNRLQ